MARYLDKYDASSSSDSTTSQEVDHYHIASSGAWSLLFLCWSDMHLFYYREMYKDIVTLKKGAQPVNFDDVVNENWRYGDSLHSAQNDSMLPALGVLV